MRTSTEGAPVRVSESENTQGAGGQRWAIVLLGGLGLAALVGWAFWLRWRYVQEIGLNVDEYTSYWAALRVLETGFPLMPSGVLYTRGILSTYVTALFLALGEPSYVHARAASVLFGLASIVAIFFVGRREWNARVGWLAALGLVLLPEAIIWSGRIRFYAQLQFFALLTIWAALAALHADKQEDGRMRPSLPAHLLFAGLFVLSLAAQEVTVLLYPALLLAMVLWRGWRYVLLPPVLAGQLVCVAALALRFAVEQIGQPGYFGSIQSYKPYIELFDGVGETWAGLSVIFLQPLRLPWTVLAVVAVTAALWQLRAAAWRPARLTRFHQASLFFTLPLVTLLAAILVIIGSAGNEPRYLLMVQSCWLLLGAAGAVWSIDRLLQNAWPRWLATGLAFCALVVLMQPLAHSAYQPLMEDYGPALAFVAQHRQPGDAVLSPQPSACAVVLGEPCTYYARERGFEPYVIQRNGAWVDRWTGAPLLTTADELEQVLRSAPRVWLVLDQKRLARRYRRDVLTTVVEQFDRPFEAQGVMALLADGWQTHPAPDAAFDLEPPLPMGELRLAGWQRSAAQPGHDLEVELYWDITANIQRPVNTSVQVMSSAGIPVARTDGPPARGLVTFDLTRDWLPDPKTLPLPVDLEPGRYRIDAVAYDVATASPLADYLAVDWIWVGAPPAPPAETVDAVWRNGLALLGHDPPPAQLAAGEDMGVRLVWSRAHASDAPPATAFLHLIGPAGLVAQDDHPPEGGFYPTDAWDVGELVEDNYTLQLPDQIPPGEYWLSVGLYDPLTGRRVLLAGGDDAVELARWTVE